MGDQEIEKSAFDLIRFVNDQITKADEIARLKGEKFNIFSILGLESAENKTHSAFIGELLNPQGSHGMGKVFLDAFMEKLSNEKKNQQEAIDTGCNFEGILDKFTTQGAWVKLEYPIGKVDNTQESGGRIDIFLRDKNDYCVSIENKIYATEQEKQIPRYKHYNTAKNEVFFLTLDGRDAQKSGELKAGKDYFLISYHDSIKKWLQTCAKEASDRPILRETIKQYIILINKLTGQLTSQEMKETIATEIGKSSKNFSAAIEIKKNLDRTMIELQKKFWMELFQALNNDEQWHYELKENSPDIKNSTSIIHNEMVVDSLIKKFYANTKSKNRPLYGLHYQISTDQKLIFSLMVNHNLWFSVKGCPPGYKISEYSWKHYIRGKEPINFKKYHDNSNVVDLFDPDKRSEIIEEIICQWKNEIDSLLKG